MTSTISNAVNVPSNPTITTAPGSSSKANPTDTDTSTTSVDKKEAKKVNLSATTEKKTEEAKKKSDRSDVLVSNRAKKVKALAGEFFSGKPIAHINMEQLKARAYEYGLITEAEYKWLKGTGERASIKGAEKGSVDLTQTLAKGMETLIDKIIKTEKDKPKEKQKDVSQSTDKLQKAADILKDPEKAMAKNGFNENLKAAMATLKEFIDADNFAQLGVTDRVSISNAATALTVIEKLAPRKLSNDKLNQYIAYASR